MATRPAPAQSALTIVRIDGKAYVQTAPGKLTALKPGDELAAGQTLVVDARGTLQAMLPNGKMQSIGGGRSLLIDDALLGQDTGGRADNALSSADADAQRVLAALASGQDPLAQLDPTAAGVTGVGGDQQGHGFVRLLRIVEGTEQTPLELRAGDQALGLDQIPLGEGDTDDLPPPVVTAVSSPSVFEGNDLVFNVTLSNPGASPTTRPFSLGGTADSGDIGTPVFSNGVTYDASTGTITIPAGITGFTITVPTTGDSMDEPNETLLITAGGVTGTGMIIDNDGVPSVITISSPNAAEGGMLNYDVVLSNANTAVTNFPFVLGNGTASGTDFGTPTFTNGVTLSGGVLSIPPGVITFTVSVPVLDDPYAEGTETLPLTIDTYTGVGTITDDSDTTTVSLSATPSVAEGGSIVYTATLTNPAGTAMSVTLSNGATIAIAAGSTTGSVSVAAPGEDVYIDAGSVSATITGTSGGNFENLSVSSTPAVTTVSDTINTVTATLTATPSVTEGGTITYTVSLTAPVTNSPVSVALSNGSSITIPVGASAGTATVTAADNVYAGGGSASAAINTITGGNFENLVASSTPAVTSITDDADVTTVSLTATPSVAEGGNITYTAALTSPAQSPVTVTLSNGATISIAAGSSTGTASIAAPADDVYIDAGNVSAAITNATGGGFESLQYSSTPAVTMVTDTTDTATATLTATSSVTEGGTITYTVSLSHPVAGSDLTLTLSNGSTVLIPVGSSAGTTTLTAADDVYVGGNSASATLTGQSGGNFENLQLNSTPAVTTITDDADVTTVSLTATPSVAEGGNITYTASLTSPAQSAVTVTLSNGATITIPAGSSTGSTSVAAPSDDVYIDASNVSASISSATGGSFENLQVNSTPAVTAVSDTINTTTVSLTATPSVAEGGSIVYTAALTSPAQSAVSVTLSNGATITIAAGSSTGTTSVAAPGEDVYIDAGSVSASITNASGGDFENLQINSSPAVTAVSDTVDTTTATLTATPSVTEGGAIIYTVSLTAAVTNSPVSVTLSNGASITIPVGASSGTATVTAADNVYAGGGTASATISNIGGGNFENLVASNAPAVTTITDDADVTTVSLTATPSVAEGGTITYTAALTSPAASPVTVTLSNGASITIAAGAAIGSTSVPAPTDDVYLDAGNVSTTITNATGGGFENLQHSSTPAVTAITDTIDNTTVSLTASASVAEGSNITYTAALTSPAQAPVTVTLSNGATITIAAGASSGSTSVAAPAEDVYIDAGSVSATINAATGGNFENIAINSTPAVTAITDTITPVTATLSATPSVTEGGAITYTVSLPAAVTGSPVSVTLSNGSLITIPIGATSGTATVTAANNVYAGGGSASATISTISGGNFEDLVASSTPAVTTITDDADVTTVSLTATPSVAEGGNITYTASLTSPAASAVTVTLSNGATITIASGASSGSTSVPAPTDDVYIDAGNVSAAITNATGGGFESLQYNSTPAVTTVTDTLNNTTVSLTASASVAEGGNITYTASLTSPAQSAVTVTLSNGATITIAAGAASGSTSVAAPTDDVYIDAGSVSATISAATGGNFESLVINSAPAVTAISDTINNTTVSLTASASVAEGGNITYTASLTSAAQSPVTVNLSNGATITIAAGASSGTVSVPAPSDDVYIDAGNVSATISNATGGNFENLVVDSTPAVTSITDTINTTTVSLTASASVAEGGNITYTASLTSAAQSPVTVTLSNGATISIPAGASSGSVSVAAPADDVYIDAGSVSTTISTATGGNFENIVINGTPAVTTISDTINNTTMSLTASASVAEGGSITYTASLTSPAQSPVTVTLSNGATITIAAGASSGSASVPAPTDDVYLDAGSVSATISNATGGNFENLVVNTTPATTSITDTLDIVTLSLTGSASVAEGATGTYTVSLTSPAQTAVTVNLSYSGTAANGSDYTGVTTVTIPAGASSANFSIATINDVLAEGAETFTVSISSATGGNFENLVISGTAGSTTTIVDDDTPMITVSNVSVTEGDMAVFTVGLTNPSTTSITFTPSLSSGTAIVGTDTTSTLQYFNGSAWVAVPGGGITFAPGQTSVQVRVATLDDPIADNGETFTLTATVTAGFTANTSATGTATISDDTTFGPEDTTNLSLSASAAVAEGGNITYTATLTNPANSAMTVTLSNGATINIAAGASSGSTSVPAPSDDVYIDAGSVSATISSATGGAFENLVVSSAAAVTTISDTINTTTVSLSATPSVAEGGNITYTASLTSPAQTAVTVTLQSGNTITIAAGASSGSISVPAPSDDVYVDAASVADRIASASGGNFENLAVNTALAVTNITDTIDNTTLSLTASPSVAEGGNITYTASLTSVAQSAVTVTLSNGSTITIAAGASSGSISIAAPGDDVYVDPSSISATISSASGGNFENLVINPATATTAITDTINNTTVSLTASASVSEGGNITYTASLNNPAQTAVTVTLSNGATIIIAAGASSASVSVAAPSDDVYIDAGSVSATISNATGGNFENLAINPAAATTAISDTINNTVVSLTASPSVAEGGNITYTASLTSVAQSTVTVTLQSGNTITIAAGASSGSISVPAPSDDVYLDAASVADRIASASGGNFENLVADTALAVTSITDTINNTTVSLTASASVAEGGNITYTASLTSPSQSAVTVTLSNGATISIPAGASSGSVSVAAPSDDVYIDAGNVSATISTATGGNFENLLINPAAATTAITDTINTTTVSLTASASVAEGGNITYTASLTSAAQSPVTVNLSNGATITIAAGASSGTVSVPAPSDDVYIDAGSVSATISSASGGNFENLVVNSTAATTSITDTTDTTTLSLTGAGNVIEGASASYTVSLTSPAQTAVTVNISYSGTAANGSDYTGVATVTIPAGASSANFSVATIDDAFAEGSESFTLSIASATGGNFENLAVSGSANSVTTTLVDNDGPPTVVVSNVSVSEGGLAVFTVSLSNLSASATTFTPVLSSGTATVGTDTASTLEYFNGSSWVAVSGAGVTIPAGSLSVQVRVATTDDAFAEGSESFTLTANVTAGTTTNSSASGTGTITDEATPDTVLVSIVGPSAVTEGNTTGNYTVSLSQAAVTAVTVTLNYSGTATNGSDYTGVVNVTIPAGATSATFSIATLDDVIADSGETLIVSLGALSGGGFEAIAAHPTNNSVTTTISDEATPDVTTVSLTASASVAEGGNITYTASLTNPAVTPVTVTLSTGQTITIAAGSSTGSVSIAAPTDDVYVDAGNVSRTISTATGGGFESLVINPAAATTAVTDTINTTTVSLTASASVAEGGNITYTASLTNPAQTPVTVTLSNGATITIATGSSTGSTSVAAPTDDVYVDAGSVSATISSAAGGNFENLVVDTTAATTTITDTVNTTTVSLSATASVAEGGNITYTASLNNPAQTPVTVTLSNGATITIAAGTSSGTVSVAAPGEDVYIDAGSVSATIATATGGNFESLAINPAAATTTITDTINATLVSLSATPSVAEGGSIVYTATLSNAAQTAVTVTITGGTTITIAAGATSGNVSVAAPSDDVYIDAGNISRSITAATGGNFESLTINPATATTSITDTLDTTTLSLTGAASIIESASGTYTLSLTSAAQTAVTVNLSYSGTAANGTDYTGVATVTIPAGASSANFSIATLDDAFAEGSENFTVSIASSSGGNFENLVVSGSANSVTTTITDEVTPDTVLVSLAGPASVTEGATTGNYTVSLGQAAVTAVTVNLSYSGTAANGSDYTGVTTVTIPAGASSVTFSLATLDDSIDEADETIVVSLSSVSGGGFEAIAINGSSNSVTTTILDNDAAPTIASVSSPSATEGANLVYSVALSNASSSATTFPFSFGSGTATAGTDYTASPTFSNGVTLAAGVLTVPAGVTSFTITVPTVSDTVDEPNESVPLSVGGVTGTGTILDDDAAPTIATVSSASATEASGIVHTVTLSNASSVATTFSLSLTDGTATGGGTDYTSALTNAAFSNGVTISGGTITVPAGVTSFTVSVPTTADTIDEVNETYTLNVGGASGTGTINDDDAAPTISSVTSASATEASNIVHTVTLSNASSSATSFTLNLTDGSATGGGVDYTSALTNAAFSNGVTISGGTITVPAGVTSFTVSVPTSTDTIDEANETYTLTVGGTSGTGTINDDDAAPTISSVSSNSATEASSIVHTVTLSNASSSATSFTLSLADVTATGGGVDYTSALTNAAFSNGVTISGGTITVPAGVTSFTVTVPTSTDTIDEVNETYTLTVGGTSGTGTINDDDAAPAIQSISSPSATEGSNLVYSVALTNASSSAITFPFSLGGGTAAAGDFGAPSFSNGVTLAAGVITIPAGVTSFTVTVPTTNDTTDEPDESVPLTIGSTTGTGTILDNDAAPTISSVTSNSATEASNVVHTVTLSNASSVATTFTLSLTDGSAIGGGVDYTSALTNAAFSNGVTISGGVITVPAGVTSFTVSVPTSTDTIDEANETYTLTVGGTSGTGTINDDDAAPAIQSVSSPSATEGSNLVYSVVLTNASSSSTTFPFSFGSGTATAGTDYTATPTFSNGVTLAAGVLTVPAGVTSFTITVPTTPDTIDEPNETVPLTVGGITGTGTINDDDAAPAIQSISSPSATEGSNLVYNVALTNASSSSITFPFSLGGGTAAAGDFGTPSFSNGVTLAAGVITIPAGVTSFTVTVPTTNDTTDEPDESVPLTIGSTTGTGTILDNDAAPTISSVTSNSATEASNVVHTVTLSNASSVATTFSLSLTDGTATGGGTDYTSALTNAAFSNGVTISGGTITVPAGVTSFTVSVPTSSDLLDEANETYTLNVGSASGTGTINDDDATPSLSINDVSVNEAAGTATFTVTLSAVSGQTVTVNYTTGGGTATAGSDYTTTSGSLTFNPGQTTRTITVPITNDLLAELAETFNVTLSGAVNASIADGTGVGTIVDNDDVPVLDLDANNSSGATGANFTLGFTEGTAGAGPSIADIDMTIASVPGGTLAGATIVLTNRQPGDALNLGIDVAGITVNTVSTAGSVTITLTGTASVADYIQRIRNISFINTDDNPSTTARTVTVQVTDGTNSSNVATTTVNVTPVNDPPLGQNATVTTNEDTAFVFSLANFPMNDAEQGNGVNPSAVRIDSLPINGSLTLNGVAVTAGQVITAANISSGLLRFTPALNANGNNYANFTFSVRDAANDFDTVPNTITVNVTPVSDGTPVAVNDNFTTLLSTPITLTAAQLMANDTLFDNPTITSTGSVSGGSLVNNGNGTWTFTPSAVGNGSFSYTITDSDGQTSTATVNITTFASNNDLATVHESALANGTGGGTAVASGNLLTNDPGASSISNVGGVTDGSANDTDARTGYIGVNTTQGQIVVDITGAGAGDYVYTLQTPANNNTAATNNSITETIAYTANTGAGNLQVTIVDDRPQAFERTLQVAEGTQPSYNLVLVLDISRSMTLPEAGGEVQIQNPDGTTSITTRLEMAKAALADLVSEYFEHSQNVSIKLVTFAGTGTGTILNGNVAYTSEAAALAAINGITVSPTGGTSYDAGIGAATTAFGSPSSSVQNISYFLSDGLPTDGNVGAQTAWNTFTTNNNIKSYAIGIGSGVTVSTAIDSIHNVDADGSGARDPAIIVPDLNDLSATLTNSVPVSFGGNVVSGGGSGGLNSALGADGGYIQSMTVQLDTNANGTPDTSVTFNYNGTQISWTGGFPSGSPITGNTLVLNASRGFTLGTLNFDFSTGDYTYFTGGSASEGSTFNISFVARDGDGDLTPPTNLIFDIIDGQPLARPDFDSLYANNTSFSGNVISGLGTDSGLSTGTLATDFTALGSGADTIADNAVISSIVFQGQTFNLGTDTGATAALGGTYTISGGRLTWTHASNGSTLIFDNDGYYNYRPATANIPNPTAAALQTVLLNTAAPAAAAGVALSGINENGAVTTVTHTDPGGTGNDGVGVTGTGVDGNQAQGGGDSRIDGLETLVFTFNTTTYPRGVENVSFNINTANSNLQIPTSGNNYNNGRSLALTYSIYHVDGHLLGTFVSQSEGVVTMPSQYSNIGRVEVQASSDAEARIVDVRFQSINLDTALAPAPVEIGYTLTDSDGDTSSSTLTLRTITNAVAGDDGANTLTGNNANDQLSGLAGNDTLSGGAGHDLLDGGIGNDSLAGGADNDQLFGGAGNDTLSGDAGNDRLTGGAGNDILSGGTGSDVFVWSLADRGAPGTPAIDTIQSFDNNTAAAGGDVLDLRDLLQGETHTGTNVGTLLNYLHFESSGGNTTVQISSGGGFTTGYNAAYVDQSIVLQGVDLTAGGTLNDQSIIQNLLTQGKLQTD